MSFREEIKDRVRAVLEKDPGRKHILQSWLRANGADTILQLPLSAINGLLEIIHPWEEIDGTAAPLKLTEKVGPVKEVVSKQFAEGSFGLLKVATSFGNTAHIQINEFTAEFDNLKGIRELITHLTSIADFLEADDA